MFGKHWMACLPRLRFEGVNDMFSVGSFAHAELDENFAYVLREKSE